MIRLGLQPARLRSAVHVFRRTQVSRAAKKLAQTRETIPNPASVPRQTEPVPNNTSVSGKAPVSNVSAQYLAAQQATQGSQKPEGNHSSLNQNVLKDKPSARTRAMRLLPKFMKSYANRIVKAPLSHVTAFLIVHELSAIVPLFVIWGGLYYFDYVPLGIPDWVVETGAQFIRRLAERQEWTVVAHAEKGSRIILQGAAAWAVVKAILPLRIAFSLWSMPWFAKWFVVPVTSRFSLLIRKLFKR